MRFANYYKNTNKYEVLGRRLDALYNLPGSGYDQSDAKIPVFYDPGNLHLQYNGNI